MDNEWFPWYDRDWLRVPVARRAYSNFAGSGYVFARYDKGNVVKFWLRSSAQAYADKLNATPTNQEQADE